jgi:hypothetical protein
MTEQEFLAIDWPVAFVVEYKDGSKETLLRGEGVSFIPSSDDPNGRAGISAYIQKRHARNQDVGRHFYFEELRTICDEAGNKIWEEPK